MSQGLWLELKCFLAAEARKDDETACHVAPLLETCNGRLAEVAKHLATSRCATDTYAHNCATARQPWLHAFASGERERRYGHAVVELQRGTSTG